MATSNQAGEQERNSDHDETATEMVKHAVKGEDEPLARKAPQAPLAMVSLAYPLLLVLALLVALVIWQFLA